MLVNPDFSQTVIVTPREFTWCASPQPGVTRVMFDRIGAEVARATSLVRYAPDSHFPPHDHALGEEILVLEGVFSDCGGDYGPGWYMRNPPGSSHQPSSAPGALIFVKLRQQLADEHQPVRIDTNDPRRWTPLAGRSVCELYSGRAEHVTLERIEAGQRVLNAAEGGAELLVLDGDLAWDGALHGRGTWIRLPPGRCPAMTATAGGVTVYLKTGHLRELVLQSPVPCP